MPNSCLLPLWPAPTHAPRRRLVRVSLALFAFGCLPALLHAAVIYKLGSAAGLQELTADDETLRLDAALGGFFAREVSAEASIDFSKGTLRRDGDRMLYHSDGERELSLEAEFIPQDGYLLVNGRLHSDTDADRAIILDYRVGLSGPDAVFSNSLNRDEAQRLEPGGEHEGNAFPLATLDAGGQAVSVAIPHDEPRAFGMVGSDQGLTVRFYLGVTPVTRAFPNEASFSFIVYPARPGWGFRAALERYYGFYPKHYEPRDREVGYYMYMVKGLVPENVKQYSYNVLEIQSPFVQQDLDRDDEYGIKSLLYTLVGQREIKFLDQLPKNYEEAMQAFENWSVESHLEHPVTKENAVSGVDKWLREEVETSAAKGPEGDYVISIRDTPWGKKSVSFKANPSPYLFADRDVHTVGNNSTRLVRGWLDEYPQIDGVIVDSLGANWPATANYRRDHMAYAKFPVTFDHQGRLFLHNQVSHYEWLKYMREEVLTAEQYLTANGVYAYHARALEHYRMTEARDRIKMGRFFMSAMLDGGASEAGARAKLDRYQDVRVMFGRKYYALTSYEWEDEEEVNHFYNRALAYGVFATNTKNYFGGDYIEGVHEGVSYVDNPRGYTRDKELIDWFLPKARMLHRAGWRPVTAADLSTTGEEVVLERFGEGNSIYFTLFNDGNSSVEATVKVDLASLGVTEGAAEFQEIARDSELEMIDEGTFRLMLEPHKTYIVSMTKTWMWGGNEPGASPLSRALVKLSGTTLMGSSRNDRGR